MTGSRRKATLRRALQAHRSTIEPAALQRASLALGTAVIEHPQWLAAREIAAFVGVGGEPRTHAILTAALSQGRRLWLPRVLDGPRGISELVEVRDLSILAPAGFGLLEPRRRPDERRLPSITPNGPLDLVLIPGLAFEATGARLGWGAGHYDRLLAPVLHSPRPVRMGLCLFTYFNPAQGPIPLESHDVDMHYIATESGIYRCSCDEGSQGDA